MTLDFFKIENELEAKKGLALISEPLSDDNYFGRSVVLLTEHSKEGSVGFVLNKESEYFLYNLIPDLDAEFKVYQGGPVEVNSLHYIHSLKEVKNTVKIHDNLFWGGDFEQIKAMLKQGLIKESQIQFFLGYSGWAPNQLEHELNNSYWIVAKVEQEEIFFNKTHDFWKNKLKRMGQKYNIWLNVPENPNLN